MKLLFREINQNLLIYFGLFLLLSVGFYLRVYKIDQLLGFYYDQGRDAQIIDSLTSNLILIGPTTGLEGIYLGPFYYYFLWPGYLIGLGNPAIASIYQTVFVVAGIYLCFLVLKKNFSYYVSLITIFFMTFSYTKIKDDRWLSNPTPASFFTPLTLLFFSLSFKKPYPFLPLTFLSLGILLQCEAASGFFIFILSILTVIIFRKNFSLKDISLSILAFLVTLTTQILFELKNNFLLTKNLISFLTKNTYGDTNTVFVIPDLNILYDRLGFFTTVFLEKVKLNIDSNYIPFFLITLFLFGFVSVKYWDKSLVRVITIWFFGSLTLFSFYQGNYGRIYSYYLTPLMPLFFIYIGITLNFFLRDRFTKIFLGLFLLAFIVEQFPPSWGYLNSGLDGDTIALGNQTQTVKYILDNVEDSDFNYDVYVPPVIPYAYDYLFKYLGKKMDKFQSTNQVKLLYTIHEIDNEMPKRKYDWLTRQDKIGEVIEQVRFGGITVERRERIE